MVDLLTAAILSLAANRALFDKLAEALAAYLPGFANG
jgi:hypothetical protein